ncbi:MAG: tetratricopeptide repeat protein [Verrucomicrobia bacterium]|nr:tetratricopeptide repeat protein [Verrucomicrobiota bacterium]
MTSVAASSPAPAPARNLWILDRWRDLVLFVGTPALLLPLFTLLQARWSAQDIYLFVAAFGAMGHHLPGMIRAYGDPALFERFRTRFIVAPILLAAVCITCSLQGVRALEVVAFVWGVWHGMMQTYGFARIYDAKGSAVAAGRARVDFLLCAVGFAGAILLSPARLRTLLDLFYDAGGPLIPTAAIGFVRTAALAAVGVVLVAYLVRHLIDWQRGHGFGLVKHVLLASSLGFWWYCNNWVGNILVGIALFEVFHDVQYLAIVWLYNGNRVQRDAGVSGFLRFVFRRSGSMVGVYVGLVFAYGALAWYAGRVPSEGLRQVLLGLVTASALLHFYYDGFIWKVRESSTRQSLGLEGSAGLSLTSMPWFRHGLRWAALIVPFALLSAAQLTGRGVPLFERRAAVAEAVPGDALGQLNYGKVLHQRGDLEAAAARVSQALVLNPKLAEAEFCLGLIRYDQLDYVQAETHYRRSIELNPKSAEAQANLGSLLLSFRRLQEARTHFEASLAARPNQVSVHVQLGDLLLHSGDSAGAIRHFEAALALEPELAAARDGLARARARQSVR